MKNLIVALALVVVQGVALAADLADEIQPLVDAHHGEVAVAVKHLATGESYRWHADKPMPTASLIKFPLMIAAYEQFSTGKLSPEKMITLKKEDKVPGSGIITAHFSAGTQISLNDAIHLMIVYSDNTATNLVIEQVGLPETSKLMEQLGCPNTKLHSMVWRGDTSIAPERSRDFGLGSTTADEMVKLLELVSAGQVVGKQACEQMLGHLRACDDRSMIPRLLPPGTVVAHKIGAVSSARCDAGLIETTEGPIALCVLTAKNEDLSWSDDNETATLCAKIAAAAYKHFAPPSPQKAPAGELHVGSSGKLVEGLQRTLNARLKPSPDLGVDGDFGAMTEAAVKAFQRSSRLPETGVVDGATWKALGTIVAEDVVSEPEVINGIKNNRQPADELDGPPLTTAAAWAIADGATGEILHGHLADDVRDIASTTKIMTAYVVLKYAQEHPEALDEIVTFSQRAADTEGSTAGLEPGETVSVRELMYGLLLPSGNDASVALAEHFGARVAPATGESEPGQSADADDAAKAYDGFIAAMNAAAGQLGMTNSHFANPNGLPEEGHHGSAADLVKVSLAALQFPLFAEVVDTPQRGCKVHGPGGYSRNVAWYNTNRLLGIEGFDGVKTGTTNAAGCCLVSRCRRGERTLLAVVLGSTSSDARYTDSRNLYRWAWGEIERAGH
jgi:D-alanyl-D-alanine carboxypeptidase (penicillin-binding protein 5/6)